MIKPSIVVISSSLALMGGATDVRAQAPTTPLFVVDILAFRSRVDAVTTRMDVYVSVPYELLQFSEFNGTMVGDYSVTTTFRDTTGRKLFDSTYKRSVVEDDYAVTRGKTGKADNVVKRYELRPGTYRVEFVVRDAFGHRDHSVTRKVVVPSLALESADLSSVMLASDIEQKSDRFTIVPYIGDVIWSNELTLFAFVEIYLRSVPRRCAVAWNITATDGRTLAQGMGEPFNADKRTMQAFVPLIVPQRLIPGSYSLRLRLHEASANDIVDTSTVLAERSRPYIVPRSMTGSVLSDVSRAIKQLIYVADQNDIDLIQGGATEAERLTRFEDYWKRHDPTPASVRNEALEEYYSRIEQANRRFKSYTEGWLTDMGRTYIVFGEPTNIEKFTAQNGVSLVVRWTYPNNTTFTFEDNTGFGDYRLRSAFPVTAKYVYRR
ncbi:MAG: GWxTD domain-containing protein [Candidatus Kapabacteria bacterium]|nr:GWxTD domain-containing protein [Candidatus Kapabacteria bacterium]